MIRVVFLLIVAFALVSLGIYLLSRLIVFWRDKLRQWKLEKEEYKRKQMKAAEQDFIDSAKILDEAFNDNRQFNSEVEK